MDKRFAHGGSLTASAEGSNIKSPSAPSPPDPARTAAAQSGLSRDTAITQQLVNMVDQSNPYGTLTYNQNGSRQQTLDNGKTVDVPRYTAFTQLSPEQQHLFAQEQLFDRKFNNIALNQTDRIGGLLGRPVNFDNSAVEGRLADLQRERLDPIWDQRQQSLDANLAARGLKPGSEGYSRSMQDFARQKNDAYNQMLLQGRGQAVNEMLTQRNQPINEVSALMNGGQVQQPMFGSTPTASVATPDYGAMVNANYQGQMNNFNQQNQQNNAMMGGLFGLGSAALGGWAMSERKTKEKIKKVGELNDGTNLYTFKYKPKYGGGLMRLGTMAGEVQKKHPEAVAEIAPGIRGVNYDTLAEALA